MGRIAIFLLTVAVLACLGLGCRSNSSEPSATGPARGDDGAVEGQPDERGEDGTIDGEEPPVEERDDGTDDGEPESTGDSDVVTPRNAGKSCSAAADPVGETSLMATIEGLAAPELEGRYPGTPGDASGRALIEARFKCLGLDAPGGSYQQPFTTEDGEETANVIAVMRGSDPEVAGEVIVVGAHHDHLGQDEQGIYLGANDDASGVAALLGLAERLVNQGQAPRRTVVFAAFGAEEAGYLGSLHYAAHPFQGLSLEDTVFMVNLDMIGSYKREGLLYALHTFPGTPGRQILDGVVADFPDLNVVLGEKGELADHMTFCEARVPVTFFFTSDDGCYHKPCDAADRIDRANHARITQLVWALLSKAADGETDLAAARAKGCGDE